MTKSSNPESQRSSIKSSTKGEVSGSEYGSACGQSTGLRVSGGSRSGSESGSGSEGRQFNQAEIDPSSDETAGQGDPGPRGSRRTRYPIVLEDPEIQAKAIETFCNLQKHTFEILIDKYVLRELDDLEWQKRREVHTEEEKLRRL